MRAVSVFLLLAGALTAVVGAGRTWLSVQVQDPVLGTTQTLVSGSAVAGTATAAGLLGAAAALVSLLTRGLTRGFGLVLALVAGGWLVWIGLSVAIDPSAAARSSSRPGGTTGPIFPPEPVGLSAATADVTLWPWIVAAAGLLMVGGVIIAAALGRSARIAAPAAPMPEAGKTAVADPTSAASPQEPDQPDPTARVWEDLSAGRDPTDDEPDES